MNMNHELMNINHEFKFLWKRRTPQNLSTANKNTLEDLESALNISWNIPPKLGQFIWIPHQNPYGFPTVCLDFSLVLQRSAVQHDMDAPGTFEPGSRVSRKVDGPFQDFLGFKIRKAPWCLNVKPGMMLIIVQKKYSFGGHSPTSSPLHVQNQSRICEELSSRIGCVHGRPGNPPIHVTRERLVWFGYCIRWYSYQHWWTALGLHSVCVSAVGIKQGIEQQEGKRQLDGASSQTMGPLLVYSGVQCDFDPYNTVEENTYSYSLVCSMVHLLVNSLCSPNFCWSTFNSCWINSQFLFGLNTQ